MATKKSTPAKKATPAKKQNKLAAKPAVKAAAKKAAVPAKKAAPVKKAPPAKKAAPKKASSAKAAPAKVVKTVPKKVVPATKAKTEAKVAPKKATPSKAIPSKVIEKAAPKVVEKETVKVEKKQPPIKKAQPAKPAKPLPVPKLSTKSAVKYQPDFTKSILDTHKTDTVKAVVRYSDNDLQEFKEIILRKLDAAKKELAYLQGLITRRDEGGDMDEGRYMTMEDGSVSMEREQLSQLASRQITFIDHLEKALMRVENKTYGICRVTGNLIDKARLRAVPHATLSMESKSMMNK